MKMHLRRSVLEGGPAAGQEHSVMFAEGAEVPPVFFVRDPNDGATEPYTLGSEDDADPLVYSWMGGDDAPSLERLGYIAVLDDETAAERIAAKPGCRVVYALRGGPVNGRLLSLTRPHGRSIEHRIDVDMGDKGQALYLFSRPADEDDDQDALGLGPMPGGMGLDDVPRYIYRHVRTTSADAPAVEAPVAAGT